MRTITIVYQRHHYIYRWLKPLLAAKKEFRALGYKIEYQSIIDYLPIFQGKIQKYLENKALSSAMSKKRDIVMMAFHHSTSDICQMPSEKRIDILQKIKTNCNQLIWLDTADSTGTCMFDVMPYVDLYFKKRVLKNLNYYCKDLYGSRLFCDYYHKLLGIEDKTISERYYPPTSPEYLSKIRVAWNVGIGDIFAVKPYQLILHPYSVTKPQFNSTDNKTLDLQYRGSGYSPIAGYPRSESKRKLENIKTIKCSDITKKIPKPEYIKEGKSAKSILSPFGWGEICGRDFEAIAYGACMLKQSMEDIITYPDIYQPMKFYIPLAWDFSDFDDKICKSASDEYRQIAKNAQNYYSHFFTREGRQEFAKHIISQILK